MSTATNLAAYMRLQAQVAALDATVKNTLAAGLLTGTPRAEQCFQTLVPCFFRDPRFRRTLTASKEARSRVNIQLSDFAEGAAAGLVGVGR